MSSTMDLFAVDPPQPPTRPTYDPKADDINIYCVERFGLHPDWQWKTLETLGDSATPRDERHGQAIGGVYPEKHTKGRKKGAINFQKPLAGTERTVVFKFVEFWDWQKARGGK